ncbi:MAG TPA: HAD family acid phosphatase [Frateuria sp.]|uniref:5'-nucleotidase, lipoprotein e(P4) family n=1 Tax=Frateuria sp. TaxID=2211372 RepID=UPI002DEEAEE0|nr:HAD family acid phosphatase [Frateuria sp.]
MPLRLPLAAALTLLAGCAAQPPRLPPPAPAAHTVAADDNLNAVAWAQTAVEHDLIYLQTYRDAQARLLAALADPDWDALSRADRVVPAKGLRPAVLLDIDETVLDNSPYQARLVRGGGEFNEADWAAWCKEGRARALPGVVAFTRFAVQHGVEVIYLSNRAKDLDQATLANLRAAGLPVAGPQSFLGLGTLVEGCEQVGSEKGCRRQLVARHHRVLMQFGDQLGDFVDVLPNTPAARRQMVQPYLDWIGVRWFVLPNPTYGSWEPALFDNDWRAPRDVRRKAKLDVLRVD